MGDPLLFHHRTSGVAAQLRVGPEQSSSQRLTEERVNIQTSPSRGLPLVRCVLAYRSEYSIPDPLSRRRLARHVDHPVV